MQNFLRHHHLKDMPDLGRMRVAELFQFFKACASGKRQAWTRIGTLFHICPQNASNFWFTWGHPFTSKKRCHAGRGHICSLKGCPHASEEHCFEDIVNIYNHMMDNHRCGRGQKGGAKIPLAIQKLIISRKSRMKPKYIAGMYACTSITQFAYLHD